MMRFPVRDPGGQRVVGFLGRALVEAEDTPRYLNSPATALYRKGEVLYGLGAEPARRALAGGARPVLVEGPLDAIAVTGAGGGRYAGVAPCGTALTAAQVAVLDTHTGPLAERGIVAAFDHDPGGRQARAARLPAAGRHRGLAHHRHPARRSGPRGRRPAPRTGGTARHPGRRHHTAGRPRRRRAAGPLVRPAALGRRAARRRPRRRRTHRHAPAGPDRPAGAAHGRPARSDPADLTRAVADAVSRDGDALGRLGRRDRRADLDRDSVTTSTTAARLARVGYPAPLRSVAPGPGPAAGAQTGAAGPAVTPQRRAARPR